MGTFRAAACTHFRGGVEWGAFPRDTAPDIQMTLLHALVVAAVVAAMADYNAVWARLGLDHLGLGSRLMAFLTNIH